LTDTVQKTEKPAQAGFFVLGFAEGASILKKHGVIQD
jgi:hypothetical protein